jgi:phosphatidylserine/phosphatidylglycerophosphate/cardiolipin synthase-like enzyme
MSGLADVSTTSLERIRSALEAGRLRAPMTRQDLVAFGVTGQLDAIAVALVGHTRSACVSILDCVLFERGALDRPDPELVWTGPEGDHAAARDTAIVLRELFEGARRRVILAGYSFLNPVDVLGPLHASMRDHGVEALFFIDVAQPKMRVVDEESYGHAALAEFLDKNWPFSAPFPEVYCDRRALRPGPPWCSLHAKCVTVDGQRSLVSSANFTLRGQERNIEVGVLLEDEGFARQLERQWMSLVEGGLVCGSQVG